MYALVDINPPSRARNSNIHANRKHIRVDIYTIRVNNYTKIDDGQHEARQAFHYGQDRGQVTVHPPCPAADQFERIRVFFCGIIEEPVATRRGQARFAARGI